MYPFSCHLLGLCFSLATVIHGAGDAPQPGHRQMLTAGWRVKSSLLVPDEGQRLSQAGYADAPWFTATVPSTVLTVLVKNGVYPDPRNVLDCYRMPDSSDEFNRKHDLAKFSYLPDKRNPWRDPYWYRTEFDLAPIATGQRVWLNFQCINYRAEVWLNGARVADQQTMVGMFQRFRFDVTAHAPPGRNALAVKICPVDHPGEPDAQLKVFGPHRGEHKEIERDVTEIETVGYDCMMTVPDRNMGICQEVYLDRTGPIDMRHPFIATRLPLPDTSQATLAISAELVNTSDAPVTGVLRGQVEGTDVQFAQPVALAAHETRLVRVEPQPVLHNPRLWWPANYGQQHLYNLRLRFETGNAVSAEHTVRFGVREIGSQMHVLDGWHGRRVLVNGQRIFCRGGYIQPELLLDWDAERIDAELRYFAHANMNLIYFEDIPNPPDAFLDACDRHGVLFGNCFYACSWVTKPGRPEDFGLLERCTIDLVKRYRNHPSLALYMAMDEGYACPEVYTMWRRHVAGHDGTRFWIPSGYFPDFIKNEETAKSPRFAHFRDDLPAGMNDLGNKSYGWQEPVTYFRWVRDDRSWMFKIESGSASLPPISSLARFLPKLGQRSADGAPFPLTEAWAHHGANDYYKPYDQALRRLHGEPESVADYCWKGHLLTADQHRAFFEAVNHRMWDITSGFTEWKINSSFPDVQWQIFDYYHKPMVSYFYIERAGRPLHVQMDLIDHAVSVINCRLDAQPNLEVTAQVFDLQAKPLWQRTAKVNVAANSYREAFAIEGLTKLAPFVFVRLDLKDATGRPLADNTYWLPGDGVADHKALQSMPLVKLDSSCRIEDCGNENRVVVKVANPGQHIAFFIQLALTKGPGGDEALPVLWDDNYFTLLPGETREDTRQRIAKRQLAGSKPALELGGWNIQADFQCDRLTPPATIVKPGEPFTVAARIRNTFLDGSRVPLLVDGQTVDTRWAWARAGQSDEVSFKLTLSKPGKHRLAVGNQAAEVLVK